MALFFSGFSARRPFETRHRFDNIFDLRFRDAGQAWPAPFALHFGSLRAYPFSTYWGTFHMKIKLALGAAALALMLTACAKKEGAEVVDAAKDAAAAVGDAAETAVDATAATVENAADATVEAAQDATAAAAEATADAATAVAEKAEDVAAAAK
jgi:hypothetical protein